MCVVRAVPRSFISVQFLFSILSKPNVANDSHIHDWCCLRDRGLDWTAGLQYILTYLAARRHSNKSTSVSSIFLKNFIPPGNLVFPLLLRGADCRALDWGSIQGDFAGFDPNCRKQVLQDFYISLSLVPFLWISITSLTAIASCRKIVWRCLWIEKISYSHTWEHVAPKLTSCQILLSHPVCRQTCASVFQWFMTSRPLSQSVSPSVRASE